MIGQTGHSTALLAASFGSMLLMAETGAVNEGTARELIVLARVLENRLGEVRRELSEAIGRPLAPVCDLYAA
jgi:hypothetical protein